MVDKYHVTDLGGWGAGGGSGGRPVPQTFILMRKLSAIVSHKDNFLMG